MSEMMLRDNHSMKVELDMQISTAKAYPRDTKTFVEEAIEMATQDQETAESCIYSVPRGGKDSKNFIKGESIRLAEICQVAWGNIHGGSRVIENDGKTVTAEGVAWDLQKNVKVTRHVKRSIVDRYGKQFSNDMQIVTGNAACAIALRNAYFGVIPRSYVKRVYDAAVKFAIGDQTQLSKRIDALIKRFQKLGVDQDRILAYFDKKTVSDFTVEDVEEMIGIGTAIKDNQLTIDKAFIKDNETIANFAVNELEKTLETNTPESVSKKDKWLDEYDKV